MSESAKSPHFRRFINGILVGVWFAALLHKPAPSGLDPWLLLLAALANLLALNQQLPLQNVLGAAAGAAVIGLAAQVGSVKTGIPLGPMIFTGETTGKLFNLVPFTIPFLWILAIFTARGVARLCLRPWRTGRMYGFQLIGLTALLTMLFDFCLEPYAWRIKHWWLWSPTKIAISWQGVSPLNFLGWLITSLLILAIITPCLIRKKPGNPSPVDWQPLAYWLGAMVLFSVAYVRAGLVAPLVATLVIGGLISALAWRFARW